jgi:C-8 sterol isomerase
MSPIFDPAELKDIAQRAIGLPTDQLFRQVIDELADRYPGHIERNPEWIFNNAGGAMGSMIVLHASITEYVIIFGSPIGTEGHTGRFAADDWFTILEGEQWAFAEGDLTRQVFRAGDQHHLPRGTVRAYRIPDRCWALEYARGFIPQMLPFGVADSLFSTVDYKTIGRLFKIYGKLTMRELAQGNLPEIPGAGALRALPGLSRLLGTPAGR